MPEALAGVMLIVWIGGIVLAVLWAIVPFAVFRIRKEIIKIECLLEGYAPRTVAEKEREVRRILEDIK